MSSTVTNLLAESTDDTFLAISWEPPATPNGNITSYSVRIINLKDGSAVKQEFISVELANVMAGNLGKYIHFIIDSCYYQRLIYNYNTEAGVPYNVSIAAVNRAGPGEFSVFIHFTRELGIDICFICHTVIQMSLYSTKYCSCGCQH